MPTLFDSTKACLKLVIIRNAKTEAVNTRIAHDYNMKEINDTQYKKI